MSNTELQTLRDRVNSELNWIKTKTDTLSEETCRILLKNKSYYMRACIFCGCCGDEKDIKLIRKIDGRVTDKCKKCTAKNVWINPYRNTSELDFLNKIVIYDQISENNGSDIRETCKSFKEKIDKEYDAFVDRLTITGFKELNEVETIKTFFEGFPFEIETVIEFEFDSIYKDTVLTTIETFLRQVQSLEMKICDKYNVIPPNTIDFDTGIIFEGKKIIIKGISLDECDISNLKRMINNSIIDYQIYIKDEFTKQLNDLFDRFRSEPECQNVYEAIKRCYLEFLFNMGISPDKFDQI